MNFPGLGSSIGRSWFVQDVDGVRAFMHNGNTSGQHTVFAAIPEKQFAIVLFINNVFGAALTEVEVLNAALSHYLGLGALAGRLGVTQAILAPPGAPTVTLSEAELADYTGRFADPGEATTFVAEDGRLAATSVTMDQPNGWQGALSPPQPPPSTPVAFLAKDAAVRNMARPRSSAMTPDASVGCSRDFVSCRAPGRPADTEAWW